jgi:hypothetical protein
MDKTLFFALFMAIALAGTAAQAQSAQDYSEMPGTAAAALGSGSDAVAQAQAQAQAQGLGGGPSASVVFIRSGMPINLVPGAFIVRTGGAGGQAYTAQAPAYQLPINPTSVANYNRSIARTAQSSVRGYSGTSPIPSPFPPGFGE